MKKINYSPNNTRTCSKCKVAKNIDEFKKDKRASQGRGFICTLCSRERAKEYYRNLPKERQRRLTIKKEKNALRNKIWICKYLEKQVCSCGEKDIRMLDFDHCNGTKVRDISFLVTGGYSIETIKKEIVKCEVICVRCHRIKTMQVGNHYRHKYLQGILKDPNTGPGSFKSATNDH